MPYIILSPNTDNILTIYHEATSEDSIEYSEYGFIFWADNLCSNSYYAKPLLSQITSVFNPQTPKYKTDMPWLVLRNCPIINTESLMEKSRP